MRRQRHLTTTSHDQTIQSALNLPICILRYLLVSLYSIPGTTHFLEETAQERVSTQLYVFFLSFSLRFLLPGLQGLSHLGTARRRKAVTNKKVSPSLSLFLHIVIPLPITLAAPTPPHLSTRRQTATPPQPLGQTSASLCVRPSPLPPSSFGLQATVPPKTNNSFYLSPSARKESVMSTRKPSPRPFYHYHLPCRAC